MDAASLNLKITTEGMDQAQRGMEGLSNTAGMLEGMLAKVAAAFGLYKMADWGKDAVLLAARYETLGVAMTVVGHNAGYTAEQMAGFQAGLEKTGISMIESRNNLTRMAAAQLDLTKSSEMARMAQDAAVIAGINSSEAFERLVQGIVSGQPRILHTMGIFADFGQAEKKWADAHGKTAEQLSNTEKVQIRFNATLFEGAKRAGAYEASMETAGKQIFSMQRYVQDLEVRLGAIFGPALQKMVFDVVDQFKAMSNALDGMQKSGQLLSVMNSLRDTIGSIVGPIVTFTKAVWDHRTEILLLVGAYASVKLGIIISGWISAMQAWVAAQKVALLAMASFNAASGEMAIASTAATVATKGMAAGMTALGGPIGILIALLGIAAVAWTTFKDKTSDEAKKSGLNIEAETVALQKKIEKQKAYWDLIARGATADQAAKGMRPTADDDPGIKDLDRKYGALQSQLASVIELEGTLDQNGAVISTNALQIQSQMNDLLAKRQKFIETFNQAQHGADLVEAKQIELAKAKGTNTVSGGTPEGLTEYGREIEKLREQITGLTVSEREAYEMKLQLMANKQKGTVGKTYDVSEGMGYADELHALQDLDAERKESLKLDKEIQKGVEAGNANRYKKGVDDLYKSFEATAFLRVEEEALNKEQERTDKLLKLKMISMDEYTKRTDVLRLATLRLKAESGDTWAIIGQVVTQNAGKATDAMVTWMDNLDGVGRSWKSLGDTVKSVLRDMIIQMQKAVIEQQMMKPLFDGFGIWLSGLGSKGGSPSFNTGTGNYGDTGFDANYGAANPGGGGSTIPAAFKGGSSGGNQTSIVVNVSGNGDTKSSIQGGGDLGKGLQRVVDGYMAEWTTKNFRQGGAFARS